MIDDINFDERVKALALLEQQTEQRIAVAQEMLDRFYQLYVAAYAVEIEALRAHLEYEQRALKADYLRHVLTTGELRAHPSLQFVRRKRWAYDKEAVLREAKERGATDFIRTKQELDVRAFEKALSAGEVDWYGAEEINDPYVTIRPLGEILIQMDLENE